METSDGRVVGIECIRDPAPGLPAWISRELSRASLPSGDAVSDRASARSFVAGLRKASTLVSRGMDGRTGRAPSLSALGWTVERALGRRPRPEIMSAASHVWLAETRERIERFLATLDPYALSLLRERTDLDDLMGRAWPGLDRTFDPEAPLAAALQARPHQARLLLRLWSEEPRSVRNAVSAGKVDRLVGGHLVTYGHLPSHLLPKLVEAERALDVVAARSRHTRPGPSGDALGHAKRLIGLSPAWQPTSTADWLAFMTLSPLTDHARSWSGPKGMLPRLLGHDGSWERLADSIVQVTRTTDMQLAVARVDAMATAYAQRVLMPAFALANGHDPDVGPKTWTAWRNAAHTILTSGQSLRGILHAATSWDGSRGRVDGLRASAPAGMEWPACLPDRRYQGSRLHVVPGEVALRALLSNPSPGASHPDADEIVRQCGMGRMRAVAMLVDDGAGWRPRSMALLRISDRPVVVPAPIRRHHRAPPPGSGEAQSR